jgi:fumarate reductase (CoM/CoB) subunit B
MRDYSIRVQRFDPEHDREPRIVEYRVSANEGARVLHVLHAIHDEIDPTLAYRHCCGSGQCGSCAVLVNGEPALACMEEARDGMTIGPLDLPVRRDLVTELAPSLDTIRSLSPGESDRCRMPPPDVVEAIKSFRSCIECLACVSACPALKVTRFAGPTAMRQEMRLALDPRDKGIDRAAEAVQEGLFTCTSCQACWKVCPKKIEIPGKAIEKLRAIAHREGLSLPRHLEVAGLIRETGRSVGKTEPTFLERIGGEVIEPIGQVKATIGFFVGCMYNLRLPQTALDAIEVLARNGIRVVIPAEQVCCGSPLIRTGQPEVLESLQKRNIEAFTSRGCGTVVTMCAGCGSTLKNDYTTPFEVRDLNEILTRHGIEPPGRLPVRVTYHDPCHLLRGQGIREEPRELIRKVAELVEMPAVCCGSGGGVKSGIPDEANALGERRGAAIRETGTEYVITSCPFCEFHISQHTDRPVRHVASLLLEGYREKDRKITAGCV